MDEITRESASECTYCLHFDLGLSELSKNKIQRSLKRQTVGQRNLILNDFVDSGQKNSPQICLFVSADIVFEPYFLEVLEKNFHFEDCQVVYSDYKWVKPLNSEARSNILLPDWSPERFLSTDYIGSAIAVISSCLPSDMLSHHELTRSKVTSLIINETLNVSHDHSFGYLQYGLDVANCISLEQLVNSLPANRSKTVALQSKIGSFEISNKEYAPELISIVIPTRGTVRHGAKSMVAECIESIGKQDIGSRKIEVVVVYDTKADTRYVSSLSSLSTESLSVVTVPYANDFNFAEKCNIGASQSSGEVIIFQNDDTLWLGKSGLLELAGCASLPNIGAAGAKLFFEDGSLQHAGFMIKNGGVGHAYFRDVAAIGPCGDIVTTHEVMGVTGACLAQTRSMWMKSGGWDESLPGSYNDVDYCFRIRAQGYSILQVNSAELTHFESISRDPKLKPFELETIQRRWHKDLSNERFMRLARDYPIRRVPGNVIVVYFNYGIEILRRDGLGAFFQTVIGFFKKMI